MSDQKIINVPVVFADRFYMSQKALNEIARLGGYTVAGAIDSGDLAEKIRGSSAVRVIVSEYVPLNDAVLKQAPALKGVIAYGAGYDHIDVEAMKRKGVTVCNCRGQNAQAVAELTFGLLLCLMRRINQTDPWIRAGEWAEAGRALPEWVSGRELWRKTLGVIGLGQIGARVVRIAKGFDMRVIGYDPFMNPDHYGRLGVEPVALEELISLSDVVTLHLPLTPDTERMIDSRMLAGAKPRMILVNTSRGKVVDEEALIDALETGRIGGAALDVFATEPLPPGHPLTMMDNVVLSPHLGGLSQEAGDRLSDAIARQVKAILEEQQPECLILSDGGSQRR
ncbi:MAG: phosphoglycerate dehydrogenase [Proteobacteria bacterium]|nr:phosphoglycerate dehydrogenase [Pseudomonadota bacterium]MBU2227162.1 phosphoglycerate dehydrogenase [Pseudomonadota bacterium]MBU2260727.1 phosphoglycerate dehydrogenase [Pseudomonadota bacterium]